MPGMSTSDESGAASESGAPGGTQSAGRSDRPRADAAGALETLGRSSGPASLILSSLADGPKHGYALTKDIEGFASVRLAPGTLYEALSRLEAHGMIEAVESHDRRRPYRLTATGAAALSTYLESQRKVADVGLRRLAGSWAAT
jgi:DNA-binding PadR family transcriptional regulator